MNESEILNLNDEYEDLQIKAEENDPKLAFNITIFIVISISVIGYIFLNILGTHYYLKIPQNNKHKLGAKISVILGWLGLAFVNITSPIVFATS